jgi:transposase
MGANDSGRRLQPRYGQNDPEIALGRKGWLFAGSDRGGERAAAMYSLVVTARLNDVDPQAWLADVLGRIADHPASRLHELLPWRWSPRGEGRSLAA